ncbi:MAG: malonyl-CoA synthase [Burkholderiaceae bacterium]
MPGSNANLYAVLAEGFARREPDACAIEAIDAAGAPLYYSWRDIDRASARLANLLAGLGMPRDARVAVQVDKSVESLLLYLACLRAGYVYLPLNSAYQQAEVDYFVENAEPSLIVCAPRALPWISAIAQARGVANVLTLGDDRTGTLLERAASLSDHFEAVARGADDLAAILYTSGTTGRSKGAMLSHGNLASNARTLNLYWRWRDGDVLLHVLPIFHVHGLFVASHGALLSGSKMIWLPKFDAAQVIAQMPRATVFMGVPTMYVRLLDDARFDADCTRGMRLFISGSAPLLTDTFQQFEARTGQRILERYGMSETVMLTSNPYDGNRVAGTVGLSLPGVQLRIVDDQQRPVDGDEIGAIQVKGPSVFGGYWRMPEKTREEFTDDGFFKTGDVGRYDANGYVSIVGRSKDLIISGGYNVYPKEIESYLDEMEGVLESAVIGVPHRDFGEAVVAVVVAQPGSQPEEAALIAGLKARIAGFKVPKRVHVIDELPRNQMGKVQKNLLRDRYSGG